MFRTGCVLSIALLCAWRAVPTAAAPAAPAPAAPAPAAPAPATPAPATPAPATPAPAAKSRLAAETAAWNKAKPVLNKYCAKCHSPAGASVTKKRLGRFDMSSYPVVGTYAATIGYTVRAVLGTNGGRAIMPADKPGSVTGAELAAVKAWSDAWVAAEQAGAHPAH